MSPRLRVISILAGSAVLAVVLTACAGQGDAGDSSGSDADSRPAEALIAESGGHGALRDAEADDAGAIASEDAQERSVISTASLRITAERLSTARDEALATVSALGGHVADEHSRSDDRGRMEHVTLTLRVPANRMDEAMDRLAALGMLRNRQQNAEDVTTQVLDVDARVKAQTASVTSLRRLLDRAATVADVIAVEKQLSSRQADLDSLLSQQKWLGDQTAQATITLELSRPEPDEVTRTGFLGGLERGWHALVTTVTVGVTALGAVLPFAVVLGVLAAVLWLLRRARRARPETTL